MDADMIGSVSVPTFSTQDLRAHATEHNRDRTHTAKWALGQSDLAPGGRDPIAEGLQRPVQPTSQLRRTAIYREARKETKQQRHRVNMERGFYVSDAANSSDDSGDADLDLDGSRGDGAIKGSHPDADITYSFDAPRGADESGRAVLGQAVEKAVERWETRVTEKLVKDEYEVVPPEHLDGAGTSSTVKKDEHREEDGFELV